jgi:hypothetical protein
MKSEEQIIYESNKIIMIKYLAYIFFSAFFILILEKKFNLNPYLGISIFLVSFLGNILSSTRAFIKISDDHLFIQYKKRWKKLIVPLAEITKVLDNGICLKNNASVMFPPLTFKKDDIDSIKKALS